MADRVSASITIGGAIGADSFAELAEIIAGESLSIEWDGEPFAPHHRTLGEPLTLHALDVAWGRFESLKAYCISEGLPFVRWCAGCDSQWGPEQLVFRGRGEPERYAIDEDEQVVLCRATVERLGSYEAIIACFDAAAFEPPPLVVDGDLIPLPPAPDPEGPGAVG